MAGGANINPTPNSGPGPNAGFKAGNPKGFCKYGAGCTKRMTCTF